MIFGLTYKMFLAVVIVAVIGFVALPGLAKFGWLIGCTAFAARKQRSYINRVFSK